MEINVDISPALMEKVDAGIEWANENLPDWREFVDPKILDMCNASLCFLGQYWARKYNYLVQQFFIAAKELFGTSDELYHNWNRTDDLGFSTGGSYTELTAAWRRKFIELGLLDG